MLEIENYNDDNDNDQGGSPPRDQPGTSHGDQSVRRPRGPPVTQDSASPRAPQGIVRLKPAILFASIQNPKKCKANTEVFSAFTGRPRGNDPSHIKLCEAGLAMAKRVFHPPEAERWPTAEANAFMKKYLTLVPNQKMELEGDLYQEAFLKEHEKNPS